MLYDHGATGTLGMDVHTQQQPWWNNPHIRDNCSRVVTAFRELRMLLREVCMCACIVCSTA